MSIQFGRYQLLRKIASGGMGQVLLARKGSEGFEKLVVLKRILPHLVEDDEFFTMFKDEARITMRLDHPNIARINEFGEEGGVHFIEMEYVAGEDVRRLDKRARSAGQYLPLGVLIRIIADAAAGLDFAHKAKDAKGTPLNLVHRDVSPQNVLVGFDGSVKLIDFGVAKAAGRAQHTATGILKGKFPYMSPEQAEGNDIDARSDIFALGIVLWELLTGKRLFKGENDLQTQKLVKACDVPMPTAIDGALPKDFDAVVLKALKKNPEERYADAGEFQQALDAYAVSHGIPASNHALRDYMQKLYAERIAKEANPAYLEEDSSLTGLDAGGNVRPNQPSATVVDKNRSKVAVGGSLPEGNKVPWLTVAVLFGLFSAFAVYWFGFRPPDDKPVVNLPINAPVPVVPTPNNPVQVPTQPTKKLVSVTSDPAGADIELNGERVGQTPMDLSFDPSKLPASLSLSRDGFEGQKLAITEATGPTLALTLKKKVKSNGTVRPPDNIKTQR